MENINLLNAEIADMPPSMAKVEAIQKAWDELKISRPQLRTRDIALEIGISEAELLASSIPKNIIRLEGDWEKFVKRLPELGYVMALTRNESCVLEHKGTFEKVATFHQVGQVIGPIETRIFFQAWQVAFALEQQSPRGLMRSLQIFDKSGEAIHKIFLQETSNPEAYHQLVTDYTSENQSPIQEVSKYEKTDYSQKIDIDVFRKDWSELKDTHDFFKLLKNHNVHRLKALELVKGEFTYQIEKSEIKKVLDSASETKLPIMIFAGNRGNIQIHIGKIRTIKVINEWLNVLDPEFNMHLKENNIDTAWVVKKPTADGIVTGIEIFDKFGELIAQFFGERKPGKPELEEWRDLVNDLKRLA